MELDDSFIHDTANGRRCVVPFVLVAVSVDFYLLQSDAETLFELVQ